MMYDLFRIGENYLDKGDEEEKRDTPLRRRCPKCDVSLVRRGNQTDGFYFSHCRRVWDA